MRVLREFDLATDGDRERRRAFSLQTRCVTALYERLFPRRYKTESCWKVYIRCVTANVQPHYRDHLGVYELDIDADSQGFFELGDADKKWWTFEQLQRGIEQLRRQTGWDEEPFEATAAQARALELRNVWRWKKTASSPSRRQKAEVWVDHDVWACRISLVVRNRAGDELSRHDLVSELPSEWYYSSHLGALGWESETRVVLTSKDGKQSWLVDVL